MGAMNRSPTPTECMLQLFMCNQCLFHEYMIFVLVHPHLPPRAPTVGADLSCPHITECTVWITVYNQCFTHVHPLWCVIAFIQFGVNGRDKSVPYAYGMYAAIVYVQSMFTPRTYDIYPRTPSFTPTYTHCREPIHRARISRNIWCGLSTHTNVYLRMPYILKCGSRAICTNKMWWYYVSWMWQQSLLSAHCFRANSA